MPVLRLELDHDISERLFPYGFNDVNHRRIEPDSIGDLVLEDFRRAVGPLLKAGLVQDDDHPLAVAVAGACVPRIELFLEDRDVAASHLLAL